MEADREQVERLYTNLHPHRLITDIVAIYKLCPILSHTSFNKRCYGSPSYCNVFTNLGVSELSISSNEYDLKFAKLLLKHAHDKKDFLSFVDTVMDVVNEEESVLHEICIWNYGADRIGEEEIVSRMARRIIRGGKVVPDKETHIYQCVRCVDIPMLSVFYEEGVHREYIIWECRTYNNNNRELLAFADEMENFPVTKVALDGGL